MTNLTNKFLIRSMIATSAFLTGEANAEDISKSFDFTTGEGMKIEVPCAVSSSRKVFLENLDSRIHGSANNLFSISPEEREEEFSSRLRFLDEERREKIIESMQKPYDEYNEFSEDRTKIEWLSKKLHRNHGIDERNVNEFVAVCAAINPE